MTAEDGRDAVAAAEDYLRRRDRLLRRLARVDAAIHAWDAAPAPRVGPRPYPPVARDGLDQLRRRLVEALARLDGRPASP